MPTADTPRPPARKAHATVIVIGIDPHKSTHTATAVDPATKRDLGSVRIRSSFDDYAQLITWSKAWPDRIWAVENASGLGHHLTQWLISRGEAVVDVPSTATARVRELSRAESARPALSSQARRRLKLFQGPLEQRIPDTFKHQRSHGRVEPRPVVIGGRAP